MVMITLDENDWGQMVDGLTCRAEDYERTAEYRDSGYAEDFILEVRDAAEARNLAAWYRRLIEEIGKQLRGGRAGKDKEVER